MFFYQDLSQHDRRDFTCSLLVEWAPRGANAVEAKGAASVLDSWCRAAIQEALSASAECNGTRFSASANEIELVQTVVQDEEDGNVLLVRGGVHVVEAAD